MWTRARLGADWVDLDELSALIGRIYAAGLDADQWSSVLVDIARSCGAESAALVLSDPNVNHSSVTAPDADPAVIAAYTTQWWAQDPTALATSSTAVGALTTLDTTGRDVFYHSAFYNEFWKQSGLGASRVATNLALDSGAFASCVLHAKQAKDETSDETVQRFGLIAPHLIRAVDIQRRMWRLDLERTALSTLRGRTGGALAIVDAEARLLFADAAAESLFGSPGAGWFFEGAVSFDDEVATHALRDLVAACASPGGRGGGSVTVRRPGKRSATVEVMPYYAEARVVSRLDVTGRRPAAILTITDQQAAHDGRALELQQRFGLTPAESVLALEILRGDGREAAAGRLGISVSTARTHLSRIYEKTGVNRQAELVRLILGAGGR